MDYNNYSEMKKRIEELEKELEETKKWKAKYRKGYILWLKHKKKIMIKPYLNKITEEYYNELLGMKTSEIANELKKLRPSEEPQKILFNKLKENLKTKDIIKALLSNYEYLETKDIIKILTQEGIQEPAIRKCLEREENRLWDKTKQGDWKLR